MVAVIFEQTLVVAPALRYLGAAYTGRNWKGEVVSEQPTFEHFLESDFRWPRRGDQAFATSPTRGSNAEIALPVSSRAVMMITGYKRAADLMVAQATRDRYDRDALVYPIIFNYRQFIELSLKYLIATYGPQVNIAANWTSHRLDELWKIFSGLLNAYPSGDPEGTDPAVKAIIAEFAKVDPNSFSYRYPVDIKGNPIPIAFGELDVTALSDAMSALSSYFSGCDGYFDSLSANEV